MVSGDNTVQVGAWGGDGGQPWLFDSDGGKIYGFRYSIGDGAVDCLHSLQFFYMSGGQRLQSPQYGILGNIKVEDVVFDSDEYLTKIQATYGKYYGGHVVITSITFVTNKRVCGPYGSTAGTSFSIPVSRGKFDGFFGNSGDVIDSIGAVLVP